LAALLSVAQQGGGTSEGIHHVAVHQHTLQSIVFLSKNLDQNMPKTTLFFGKKM